LIVPPRPAPNPLRLAGESLVVYAGLVLLGLICLAWTLPALLLQPLLPRRAGRRLGRAAISIAFRIYLHALAAMRACRFDIGAIDALRGEPPLIIAANHPCLLDAVLIISRLPVTCVMKAELMRNIFLGAGARLAGYVRNDSLRSMVSGAIASLREGSQLLVFPEGTRSTQFPVSPFVGSIALIARSAGVPVQTIFVDTDSAYLGKGWPLFRKPALPITYRLRLGRRFAPPDNLKAFTAELEAYFQAEFSGMPHMLESWLKPTPIADAATTP
jgi:1-acyl-sn-glycerol-3-phosphate acyltransferase